MLKIKPLFHKAISTLIAFFLGHNLGSSLKSGYFFWSISLLNQHWRKWLVWVLWILSRFLTAAFSSSTPSLQYLYLPAHICLFLHQYILRPQNRNCLANLTTTPSNTISDGLFNQSPEIYALFWRNVDKGLMRTSNRQRQIHFCQISVKKPEFHFHVVLNRRQMSSF